MLAGMSIQVQVPTGIRSPRLDLEFPVSQWVWLLGVGTGNQAIPLEE